LWQLIKAYCPEKSAAKDQTRIGGIKFYHRPVANDQMLKVGLVHMRLCINLHGPKFYEHETAPLKTDARLPVKDWSRRGNGNPQRD
jgi:hypothetical protein